MVTEPDEEEGGPVKSFLEHLEDLRWTLIKSLVTIAIAMLICLIAGDKVVAIAAFRAGLAEQEGIDDNDAPAGGEPPTGGDGGPKSQ